MTKKQRNKEYWRVYKKFHNRNVILPFVCIHLFEDISNIESDEFKQASEEFQLFYPPNEPQNIGWWNRTDRQSRLNALAFCIAMTE